MKLLLLTDADCVPASEFWIQKMQDAYVKWNRDRDWIWRLSINDRACSISSSALKLFIPRFNIFPYALAGMPYMGVGRNLSYKKDVFIRNKGFSSINHIPSGDDDLFINKVATKQEHKQLSLIKMRSH